MRDGTVQRRLMSRTTWEDCSRDVERQARRLSTVEERMDRKGTAKGGYIESEILEQIRVRSYVCVC